MPSPITKEHYEQSLPASALNDSLSVCNLAHVAAVPANFDIFTKMGYTDLTKIQGTSLFYSMTIPKHIIYDSVGKPKEMDTIKIIFIIGKSQDPQLVNGFTNISYSLNKKLFTNTDTKCQSYYIGDIMAELRKLTIKDISVDLIYHLERVITPFDDSLSEHISLLIKEKENKFNAIKAAEENVNKAKTELRRLLQDLEPQDTDDLAENIWQLKTKLSKITESIEQAKLEKAYAEFITAKQAQIETTKKALLDQENELKSLQEKSIAHASHASHASK